MRTSQLDQHKNQREKLERAGTLHWFHWLVVGLSLCVTLFAWNYSRQQLHSKVEASFDREADHVIELVQERMRKYEDALTGGVAYLHASGGDVGYSSWVQYATKINIEQKYPGINGIGVIHNVPPDTLDSYLKEQRIQRPQYKVHPPHEKNEYYPITYIVPAAQNAQAVGLDMAHESNRYTALLRSRDSGESQITGPITLVQDSGQTPGFLFYAPVYQADATQLTAATRKEQFLGVVYAPFVVKKLMEGTLQKEKRHVALRITDGNDLLFDEHHAGETTYDPNPLFRKTVDVPLYGRVWKFEVWSDEAFREAATSAEPLTILFGGLAIDSLLVVLFVMISRASRNALTFAEEMTHALKQRTEELETRNKELEEFNRGVVERELRMIQLKKELNEMSMAAGNEPAYDL